MGDIEKREHSLKEIIIYVLLSALLSGGVGTTIGATQGNISVDKFESLEARVEKVEENNEKITDSQTEMLVILGEISRDLQNISERLDRDRE